jgi:hypothetical protein
VLLLLQSDYARAEEMLRRAVAIREGAAAPDPIELGRSLHYLGTSQAAQQRLGEAEATLKRSVAVLEAQVGRDDPTLLESRRTYEQVLHARPPVPASPAPDF